LKDLVISNYVLKKLENFLKPGIIYGGIGVSWSRRRTRRRHFLQAGARAAQNWTSSATLL
jgi:hypothetical protein